MKMRVSVFLFTMAVSACTGPTEQQPGIIFASKTFFDSAQTTGDGYVYVAGTLTGEGLAYENNTTAIACYKERMECISYGVNQIGPNQIGRLDSPRAFSITKWDVSEIVAAGNRLPGDCHQETISIVRQSQLAVWIVEPINQASAACKDADTRLRKWTIEDAPFWPFPGKTEPSADK